MFAQRNTLINALLIAALQYDQDAKTSIQELGHERLAESFKNQAREARKLMDEIEQADAIRLQD